MTKKRERSFFNKDREIKANEAKTVRKIVFISLLIIVLLMGISIYSGYAYIKSALGAIDETSNKKIEVNIPIGSTSSQIARELEEKGLIKSSKVFRFYTKFKNYSNFQAGEYILTPSLTLDEIIQELQTGKVIEKPILRVTIPEGKTVAEIAKIVAEKLDIPEDEFLGIARDEKFITSLMTHYPSTFTGNILDEDIREPLEGYLFATTYDIYKERPTADTFIKMMVEQTDEVMNSRGDQINSTDLSVHEVLTFASIVERESKFKEDRPKVAQVFLNRLDKGMRLQSDITAAYAIDEHKIVMSYDDIEVDSPYNTYVRDGLPPGPIAAPSTEAIDAVLNPEGDEFTYLYFYARPSGETFYTNSLEEHGEIIAKYRQEWYDLNDDSK